MVVKGSRPGMVTPASPAPLHRAADNYQRLLST